MPRLAQSLGAVEIKEQSGFGNDEWVYKDLDQRTRWKGATAAAISREELAQQGAVNLCDAILATPTGSRYVAITRFNCPRTFVRVLLDGALCQQERKLTDFTADEIETIEYFPRVLDGNFKVPSDLSGNLAARGCPPAVFVIWLRHEAAKVPRAVAAAEKPDPVVDSTGRPADERTRPPPDVARSAGPLARPSYLQGQVVDSTGRPLRAAVVYTEDPPRAALSDKKGFFRLGDLPSGPVTIRVERGGFDGTQFELRLPPDSTVGIGVKLMPSELASGSVQIDSVFAPGISIPGRKVRVLSEDGAPVMYANVAIEGAMTRITDEKGEINLTPGKRQTFTVSVSRIGFARWFGKVDLPSPAVMTVTLPRIAESLAPISVAGVSPIKSPLALTGFYERWRERQLGALSGTFIGPEEIESRHPSKITDMLRGLNGVMIAQACPSGTGCSVALSPANRCQMAVLIDGMQQRPEQIGGSKVHGIPIDMILDANDVMAIEVYPRGGNMPVSLQGDDTICGVLAFWTGSRR
jgi:hypothetical protein